jgi:hypothetical protein
MTSMDYPASRWKMSSFRLKLVHVMVAVLLMGHCAPGLLGRRHVFPFSSVHMYSKVTPDEFTVFRPMCVPAAEGQEEFSLIEYPYIAPFHADCMTTIMISYNFVDPDPDRVRKILEELLSRYERKRSEGLHKGPPIRAIKLYRLHWNLVGTDLDTVGIPDETEVLMEVELDSPQPLQ